MRVNVGDTVTFLSRIGLLPLDENIGCLYYPTPVMADCVQFDDYEMNYHFIIRTGDQYDGVVIHISACSLVDAIEDY